MSESLGHEVLKRNNLFNETWIRLSEQDACDELGGMEYERVRAEWIAAGRPVNYEQFIYERANIGPVGE